MSGLRVDRFEPWDLTTMTVQPAQRELAGGTLAQACGLSATGRCFTVRSAGGAILLCGGALETHGGYATLWSAVSPAAGPAMTAITRRVRQFIRHLPHRRIDAIARAGFAPAHRWLGMLGFAREGPMGDYFDDGEDAVVYRLMRGQTTRGAS